MRIAKLGPLTLCLALLLPALAVQAQPQQPQQPQPPAAVRAWLFNALRTAPTEPIARAIEDQIWRFWMGQAPDQQAADLMNEAMKRRQDHDFAGAMKVLDKLVAHAPDWAEAWNQRATVEFARQKLDASLADADKALALEPKHFGALAGKALILMQEGRVRLGQKALRKAVAIDPWLKERGMLLLKPPGQKL